MKTIKAMTFAVVAGLPLAIVPALAQNSATMTTPTTQAQTTGAPGAPSTAYTQSPAGQNMPNSSASDSTGQTQGPIGGGASSGGGAK